jgi:hypothetical protein
MLKNFHFCMSFRKVLGPNQNPIQWIPGIISLGVKRQELEADHSHSTSNEVKKTSIYIYTPPYGFMS